MKRFLFDSGIASDYINRRHGVYDRARQEVLNGHRLGIGIPVLAELHYGIRRSASRDENLRRLHRALAKLMIWPLTESAAAEYGRIAAELRELGRPMQVVDMMIAAIAFTLGNCTVVTSDTDLSAIPGLRVENWAT